MSWNENKERQKAQNIPSGNIVFGPIDYCQVKQFLNHRHDFSHLFEFTYHEGNHELSIRLPVSHKPLRKKERGEKATEEMVVFFI